jgi:hypothetical protein
MFAWLRVTIVNILFAVTTSEAIRTTAGVIIHAIFTNAVRRARITSAFVHVDRAIFARVARNTRTGVTVYTILEVNIVPY